MWSYRTTTRNSIEETPFALAFGSEVVVPVEISLSTARTEALDAPSNDEELHLNLDFLEEKRETSQLELAEYQRRVKRHYDARVKPHNFRPSKLVLRKVLQKGEGPYQVKEERRLGTYTLTNLEGKQLPHPWNAQHLLIYYH